MTAAAALTASLAPACAPSPAASGATPTIRLVENTPTERSGDSGEVEVVGLPDSVLERLAALDAGAWPSVLAVYTADAAETAAAVEPAGGSAAPPILGSYRAESDRAVFTPRFPFVPGMAYTARYLPPGGGEPVETDFSIPTTDTAGTTIVTAVYPSSEIWPMNQLKMYIQFSAPMPRSRGFRHIRLIDEATGVPVEQPFVTIQEELWDQARQTLTVLYDPGRIKRGLVPNEEAGLPLQEGRTYRLIVDSEWRDAAGRPLRSGYERRFTVGPVDRSSPDPEDWVVSTPAFGSRDPLVLRFPEPMDRGLLQTLPSIVAAGATGALLGRIEIAEGETEWRFRPAAPWRRGDYEIVVPTILEDLAGNNLKNLFDVDRQATPSRFAAAEVVRLPFSVGAATRPGGRRP